MRQKRLQRLLNIDDVRRQARRRAHKMVFDYIDGGADDEVTLRENSAAFGNYALLHRVLRDVQNVDTSIELLGQQHPLPFFTAPAAGNRLFHKDGERAVAAAANKFSTVYCLSTLSSVSIEEIAAINPGPKWFQLYVWRDRGLVKEMLDRAREAGYQALILTVDFPITGNRERDPRNDMTIPPSLTLRQVWEALKRPAWSLDYALSEPIRYANLAKDQTAVSLSDFVAQQLNPGFSWQDAEWLLSEWNGPAVIKGVAREDDAKRAVEIGFNAIMVSNHGGRQLDHSAAPIDLLPGILDAVGNRAEVIVDGGVRRGTDILKALALGAKAVSFGRPYLYGLAAAGEAGVTRVLQLMAESVRRDMALIGISSLEELDRSFIVRR